MSAKTMTDTRLSALRAALRKGDGVATIDDLAVEMFLDERNTEAVARVLKTLGTLMRLRYGTVIRVLIRDGIVLAPALLLAKRQDGH